MTLLNISNHSLQSNDSDSEWTGTVERSSRGLICCSTMHSSKRNPLTDASLHRRRRSHPLGLPSSWVPPWCGNARRREEVISSWIVTDDHHSSQILSPVLKERSLRISETSKWMAESTKNLSTVPAESRTQQLSHTKQSVSTSSSSFRS